VAFNPKMASKPIIVAGTMIFLALKISNTRHKTPNPIIAINVVIL
jgi:hypothetical protein